jgi:DNA-directed RNA polymerase subunit RPC12/RpoP
MEKCKKKFRCVDCGKEMIIEALPSENEIQCPLCCDGLMYKQKECLQQCSGKCKTESTNQEIHDGLWWEDLYGPLK